MRSIYILMLMVIFSGCALKPKYAMQTATGLEIGINKDSNKVFKLIDRNHRVIAQTQAAEKKLIFTLPSYTSPDICYSLIDDKGEPLYGIGTGLKITSIYDYNQKIKQKNSAQQEYSNRVQNEKKHSYKVSQTKESLNKNKLFNGRTCDLPPQRPIPPYPTTICGSYSQCQKLAQDSCIKNLVDAESCGLALAKTNVHSSISSVSCGALLSSLNGENYGISSGVQDAITGYLDQHTKNKIDSGEYGEAFGTAVLRVTLTYFRTQNCKANFTKAAYAPIERWKATKEYIEREPRLAQNRCITLIHNFNSSLKTFEDNKSRKESLEKEIVYLSALIEKEKNTTSEPALCALK